MYTCLLPHNIEIPTTVRKSGYVVYIYIHMSMITYVTRGPCGLLWLEEREGEEAKGYVGKSI